MAGSSFKPQYRQSFRTPSPPPTEPITPVEEHPDPFRWEHNGIQPVQQYGSELDTGTLEGVHYDGFSQSRPAHARPAAVMTSLVTAHQARPNPTYSQALGSPIDTLANAASSLAASPVFAQPSQLSRRSSHAPISPTTTSHLSPTAGQFRYTLGYDHEERPSKRARSEFFPSPQHPVPASRPATSHVPSQQWSHNVEEMVDNGTRMYQEQPIASMAHDDSFGKRLSEAQLLLDFQRAAFSTSLSTQSQPPATNEWSTVYTAHSDMPNAHGVLVTQNLISHHVPSYPDTPLKNGDHSFVASSSGATVLKDACDESALASAVQTHTPPDDAFNNSISLTTPDANGHAEHQKPKSHQGWPKGKLRGPRTGCASGKKRKAPVKIKSTVPISPVVASDQLRSPQSLPNASPKVTLPKGARSFEERLPPTAAGARDRRHSASELAKPDPEMNTAIPMQHRASSVPLDNGMTVMTPTESSKDGEMYNSGAKPAVTICAGCNFSSSTVPSVESQNWILCNGCNGWFHFACAGFKLARDVRGVDKYFCRPCRPAHGPITYVRKSTRPHTTVDYAGLNDGVLRTSDDTHEHHYIQSFKDGTYQFDQESFARMPPELVKLEYFEKMNGFREPIVIPASLNPRATVPGSGFKMTDIVGENTDVPSEQDFEHFDYDSVPDDGQDKLDMVIPQGLTVRRVAEMYGLQERVEVIDVKSQEGEDKRWDMKRWADYYEQTGEKKIRNVISLEVSQSKLGRLIRRPKVVRDMDLQDLVWPEDDKANAPKVQFYCLMSVADCYTDFHIDFGGSSVYYHIVRGKKTFFFIPPTKQNLKKYEDWCLSPAQNWTFLPDNVKECYRIDLSEGDTMLIPSGWIHAVWTPENSLVIGGNFLTRLNYGMQIRVAEVEKATKVARKFRYPHFQKVLWLAVVNYLKDDPLPQFVAKLLSDGNQFERQVPIYCEPDSFGHNSKLGTQYYNSRYYSKAELDGLPDLGNYIWRTVMISLGRIEGITTEVRNAVTRSIPKEARANPLELAKKFAMWAAWKRGNENIPQWAHPEALLPEAGEAKVEKKLSAAAMKKLERRHWSDAIRASRDRPSRQNPTTTENVATNNSPSAQPLAPASHIPQRPVLENGRHLSTPKTSQLGPKRIACDACRRRRIRCKHKDELTESQKSTAASSPILVNPLSTGSSSSSGVIVPSGQNIKLLTSDLEPVVSVIQKLPNPNGLFVGNGISSSDISIETMLGKAGRVKACLDCRKSKRRCIHDQYGRVDPIKASEVPVPRGSATKKRPNDEDDSSPVSKKLKRESLPTTTLPHNEEPFLQSSPAIDPRFESSSHPPTFMPEIQESITVSPLANTTEFSTQDQFGTHDLSVQAHNGDSVDLPSALSHGDPIISSIEHASENLFTAPTWEQQDLHEVHIHADPVTPHRKPGSDLNQHERTQLAPSSPLLDIARGPSAENHQHRNGSILDSVHVNAPAPRRGNSGRKASQTPPPSSSGKRITPKSAGISKSRRDSKGTIKVEQKARALSRAMSQTETEEEASLRFAKELQQQEYSLRRRGSK